MSRQSVFRATRLAAILLLAARLVVSGQEIAPVLNKALQALQLPAGDLEAGRKIEARLVVTYSDVQQKMLFAQDDSAGIFIVPGEGEPFPSFGESIDVNGTIAKGSHLPYINNAKVRLNGVVALPAPRTASIESLAAGQCDSQWMEFTARVRGFRRTEERAELFLVSSNITTRVLVREAASGRLNWSTLADAMIRLHGVGGVDAWSAASRGGMLYVQNTGLIQVVSPGISDVFSAPMSRIGPAASQPNPEHRARVRGNMLRQWNENRLALRDSTGELTVESLNAIAPQQGDVVEASGFVSMHDGMPTMETAQTRLLGVSHQENTWQVDLESTNLVPMLTSAAEVRRLTPSEANRHYPVRLRGVLTYANTNQGDAFLNDGVESVYLYACHPISAMQAQQQVEVNGESGAGLYAPIVVSGRAAPLGAGIWPAAERVSYTRLASGVMDAQWIEIDAVLRSVNRYESNWFMSLASSDGIFEASMPVEPGGINPTDWVDAKLRLRGNCGTKLNPKNQFLSPFLFIPGQGAVSVLTPPPEDPFGGHPRTIESLRQFKLEDQDGRRVHVRGVVTWRNASNEFVAQDETGGIHIRLAGGSPPSTGESLDIAAFPTRILSNRSLRLDEAVVRSRGTAPAPAPKVLKIRDMEQGEADSELAVIEGRLLAMVSQTSHRAYYLEADGRAFAARLDLAGETGVQPASNPAPGSWLRLTGVIRLLPDLQPAPDAIQILLRDNADVVVVTSPPWWTWRHSLISLSVLALLGLGSGAWIVTLRVKIAEQEKLVREKMDKELAMEAQLRQSQKMEAVGQLAGGIAHDFNNLLQVIQGNAHNCALEIGPESPGAESLGEISTASNRAAEMVKQLLTFSRNVPRRMERLDISQILMDLTKMLRHLIRANVRLEVRTAPGIAPVLGDRGQLEQVLVNLCINARDAMPDGGRLDVEARNCLPGEGPMKGANSEKCYVLISVKDTGHGIPKEIRHRIFEPFFTTKEVGKGTGLGLSTVYAILHDHEGSIEVESEPGRGAAFLIYLPAAAQETEQTPGQPMEEPPIVNRLKTILLAEDEDKVRALTTRVLTRAGYRVLAAADGEEAIKLVEQNAAKVDLAILDIVMPRKSGGAVYRELRERWPRIECLFTSGYSFDALNQSEIPGGEVPLLAKPYDPHHLIQTVGRMLDKQDSTGSINPSS